VISGERTGIAMQQVFKGDWGAAGDRCFRLACLAAKTNDLHRVHRLAERLKSGGVYVNGANTVAPHLPFGGLGVSGYGKEGGRAGIDEFLRYKTVAIG
jgi:acyl-CoA reductase-like NAD-dependent aldehyde dehydrogenase